MSDPIREYRNFNRYESRDITGQPGTIAEFVGDAVVYNSRSLEMFGFHEQFSPGAFRECLDRAGCDLRALVDHDPSKLLGRQSSGTLTITDGPDTLHALINVPDVSYARDALVSIRRRDISGMSFSFDEIEDTWAFNEDGSILRTVRKADIYEVTITGFPAYPATTVDARSYYKSNIDRLEEVKRGTAAATEQRDWLDDRLRLLWRLHEAAR
jgi:hypothetical protein